MNIEEAKEIAEAKAKAKKTIASLEKRYGKGHLYYACHVAFPLILTPGLMYQIWYNFRKDTNSKQLIDDNNGKIIIIPWVAIYDLLFSSIFREIAYNQFELKPGIRLELLSQLQDNDLFGNERINELAVFLKAYHKGMEGHSFENKDCEKANLLYAEAVLNPGSEEISNFLNRNFYYKAFIEYTFDFAMRINERRIDNTKVDDYEKKVLNVPVDIEKLRRWLDLRTDKQTIDIIIDQLPMKAKKLLDTDHIEINKIGNHLIKLHKSDSDTLASPIPIDVARIENQLKTVSYNQKPCIIIGIGEIGAKLVYGVFQNWVDLLNDIKDEPPQTVDFFVYDTPHIEIRDNELKIKAPESILEKIKKDKLEKNYPKKFFQEHILSDTNTNYLSDTNDIIQSLKSSDKYEGWNFPEPPSTPSILFERGAENDIEKGRMAFLASLRAKDKAPLKELEDALKNHESASGESYKSSLNIVIVNSLFGGTGSGTFIQFALYLKNYSSNLKTTIEFVSIISNENNIKPKAINNENKAIDELEQICTKNMINLQKKYGSNINDHIPLFNYCSVYNDEEKIPESLDDLKDNVISKSIFYQNLSFLTSDIIEKKKKSIAPPMEPPFLFCNPLAIEFIFPKEEYEEYQRLKAVNQFISQYFRKNEEETETTFNSDPDIISSGKRFRQKLKHDSKTETEPKLKQFYDKILSSEYKNDKKGKKEKKADYYLNILEEKLKEDSEYLMNNDLKVKQQDVHALIDKTFINDEYPKLEDKQVKMFQIVEMRKVRKGLKEYKIYIDEQSSSYKSKVQSYINDHTTSLGINHNLNDLHPDTVRLILYELHEKIVDKIFDINEEIEKAQKNIDLYVFSETKDVNQLTTSEYQELISHYKNENHIKTLNNLVRYMYKMTLYKELKKVVINYLKDQFKWNSKIHKIKHEFEIKANHSIEKMRGNTLTYVIKMEIPKLDFSKGVSEFREDYHTQIDDIINAQLRLSALKNRGESTTELQRSVNNDSRNFFITNTSRIFADFTLKDIKANIIDAIKQKAEFDNQPIPQRLTDQMEILVQRTKKRGYPSEVFFLMHPECYKELIKLELNPFKESYNLLQSESVSPHKIICFCDNFLHEIKTDFHQELRDFGTIKRFNYS